MDTITATIIDYEPVEFLFHGLTIPVVVGFGPNGELQTAADLARRQRIDPAACDHAGATWSSNLAMRCPKCGSPMFLPPRLLSYMAASTIAAMDVLWSAAGWPEWHGESWSIMPQHWTIEQSRLFDHCGGLAIRNDRRETYYDALLALAADDAEVNP